MDRPFTETLNRKRTMGIPVRQFGGYHGPPISGSLQMFSLLVFVCLNFRPALFRKGELPVDAASAASSTWPPARFSRLYGAARSATRTGQSPVFRTHLLRVARTSLPGSRPSKTMTHPRVFMYMAGTGIPTGSSGGWNIRSPAKRSFYGITKASMCSPTNLPRQVFHASRVSIVSISGTPTTDLWSPIRIPSRGRSILSNWRLTG